jgi:multiple sugar transport system permease protein
VRAVGNRLQQLALHGVLAAGGVVILSPFAIMLRTAFTPQAHIFGGGSRFEFTVSNFTTAWESVNWLRYYRNGLVVTLVIFVMQVATALPAGYALARLEFRGRGLVWALVLVCLVVPIQVTAIPVYVGLSRVGLTDSVPGLVIPFAVSAFGIYLFRQFILTIPAPVFDAAHIDGVGPLAMVWHVVLPNVRPALVAFGIFSVTAHWNDLFWPSVILRTTDNATVPYGIAQFANADSGTDYGPQMAAATLAVVPLLVAFLFAQRQLVRGLALASSLD